MANSKKRCRYCKEYHPESEMINVNGGWYCDIEHATKYAYQNKEKGKQIKHKAQKKALKDNGKPLRNRAAQDSFNAFIRFRDRADDCISCGRTNEQVRETEGWKTGGDWDCGHYLTRGAFPELRFEELNAHKQCKSCNGGSDKYSRKTHTVREGYRENLINKIGLDSVDWLEGKHEPKKYTVEELKSIELHYKEKLKMLQ